MFPVQHVTLTDSQENQFVGLPDSQQTDFLQMFEGLKDTYCFGVGGTKFQICMTYFTPKVPKIFLSSFLK